jgi:serine/threonine protein phosphatase PrpC
MLQSSTDKLQPPSESSFDLNSPRVKCTWFVNSIAPQLQNEAKQLYSSSNDIKVRLRAENVWKEKLSNNRQFFFDQLLKRIPSYRVDAADSVCAAPMITLHNNYGFNPGFDTPILKTAEKIEFAYQGETIEIDSPPAFTDGHQIFALEKCSIFADAVSSAENEKGYQVFALADGCNWGERPQLAAQTATQVALQSLTQAIEGCQRKISTQKIAEFQLNAFVAAHQQLIEMQEQNVAETTLTLGTIIGSFGVFTSLGDGQTFLLRQIGEVRKCFSIFEENRSCSLDAKDPGGRIGPYDSADWRNLTVAVIKLVPKDIILTCSDGVSDNFDPNLQSEVVEEKRRRKLITRKVVEIAGDDPATMGQKIVNYISDLTVKKKLAMLKGEKEPADGTKVDHASMIVCEYSPPEKKSFFSSWFSN